MMLSRKSMLQGAATRRASVLRHDARPLLASPLQPTRIVHCSAASSDPYTLLGIKPDADQNEINRAITKKKYENRGNDAMLRRINQAADQLMLSALNQRMKGGVSKSIAYADREPLFPWKPKRWDATPKIIMIVGAVQLVLVASAFQAPSTSKVIGSMLVGVVGNVMKQNAISPPPKDPEMATEEEEGRSGKNFIRGALLGLMATAVGILVFTLPEYILQWTKTSIPGLTPGLIVSFKVAGTALLNWIMTSFYY